MHWSSSCFSSLKANRPDMGEKTLNLVLRAVLAAALLAVGTLGTERAAFAQPAAAQRGLVGTVNGDPPTGADTFVLTMKREGGDQTGDVTIDVVPETKFRIPGDTSASSTTYNFANGERVALLAELVSGTTFKALHLHLIPAKGQPSYKHHVGTITAYDFEGAGSVTILPKTGGPVTYTWGANAEPTIKFMRGATAPNSDGERATLVLKRNAGTGGFDVKQILVFRAKGPQA
ncbi:MAG: hypothetical protein HW397_492 [Dehalococcoidia bacterium]|nr:hypothetical protein [Dehalococcoidia bacterium]